jgi:hypothetical protein
MNFAYSISQSLQQGSVILLQSSNGQLSSSTGMENFGEILIVEGNEFFEVNSSEREFTESSFFGGFVSLRGSIKDFLVQFPNELIKEDIETQCGRKNMHNRCQKRLFWRKNKELLRTIP